MEINKYPNQPVLLVDDELQLLESCSFVLRSAGINNIIQCHDSRDVMPLLSRHDIEAIVLDITMPYISGMELMPSIMNDFPDIPIIVLTGADELETAVKCMKFGAFDYLVKSVEDSRFVTEIKRAIEMRELKRENSLLKQHLLSNSLQQPEAFSSIITNNTAMQSIFKYIETIAGTTRPVLIIGETGVGKELIAKAIHAIHTTNRKGNFIAVNVTALDDAVFADTLFGHKRGAFTGANHPRRGLIEQASGGTLFIDEIGDMDGSSQIKLLRLLQEGNYYPLGSDIPKRADARIIVATQFNINKMLEKGGLRKDLYYRLRTHQIEIPPLRERIDDLPILLNHFLETSAETLGKKKPTPPRELCTLLSTYHFPGNIRELESLIFDAVSRHTGGTLSMGTFRQIIARGRQSSKKEYNLKSILNFDNPEGLTIQDDLQHRFPTIKETEQFLIAEAMKRANNNQTIASQLLGITRSALNKRLNRSHES